MEKINFLPLIEELKVNSAFYNQCYNNSEMKYTNLPAQTIVSWMVDVLEPIVKSAAELNSSPEKIHQIVKPLYLESLKLIGSGLAIRYKNAYRAAWLLMATNPNLILKFPSKTISLLNDVLFNLNTFAPDKVFEWCAFMEATIAQCKTIEEFKIVGRIYAWKCGLAHLRRRLKADFKLLSVDLQEVVIHSLRLENTPEQSFEKPWSAKNTRFEGVQGGFEGITGFFKHPPKVALLDGTILVTDSINSYALFADQFGKILLPADTVDASNILSNSKRVDSLKKWLGQESDEIESGNISSVVITENTLVYTLQNSFFIHLYSLENG